MYLDLALAITGLPGTPSWPKGSSRGPRVRPGPLLSPQLVSKVGLDQRLHNPAWELWLVGDEALTKPQRSERNHNASVSCATHFTMAVMK